MEKISDIDGMRPNTSLQAEYSCGLGNFAIEGIDPADIQKKLMADHRIYTISIDWENIHGIRVTPNVYTTTDDLDRFSDAVHEIADDLR